MDPTGQVYIDLGYDSNGNIIDGIKTTSGAPATTAGFFEKACLIANTNTGVLYVNTGSVASPSWTIIDTGTSFSLPVSATDGTTTTGTSFQITESLLSTGNGIQITAATAHFTTGGALFNANLSAAVAGNGFVAETTGVYVGTGLLTLTATAATTGIIAQISAAGLTSGSALKLTGGGANMISGGNTLDIEMGAATLGTGLKVLTSGAYAGTDGVVAISAAAATTGIIEKITGSGLTSGIAHQVVAAVAVLTSGRYYSANNGATEVFGIGANGHIHSTVSTSAPSCTITAAHGLSAATITAGSTDTCGVITTTGTQDNSTDSTFTLTFGKTYTTAPKSITLTAANGAGAVGSSLPYIVSISATAIVIGVTKSAAAAATPSWYYQVIA